MFNHFARFASFSDHPQSALLTTTVLVDQERRRRNVYSLSRDLLWLVVFAAAAAAAAAIHYHGKIISDVSCRWARHSANPPDAMQCRQFWRLRLLLGPGRPLNVRGDTSALLRIHIRTPLWKTAWLSFRNETYSVSHVPALFRSHLSYGNQWRCSAGARQHAGTQSQSSAGPIFRTRQILETASLRRQGRRRQGSYYIRAFIVAVTPTSSTILAAATNRNQSFERLPYRAVLPTVVFHPNDVYRYATCSSAR